MRKEQRIQFSIILDILIYTFFFLIFRNCDRLDVLAYKVPPVSRTKAKMKVNQLKYDIRHLEVYIYSFKKLV